MLEFILSGSVAKVEQFEIVSREISKNHARFNHFNISPLELIWINNTEQISTKEKLTIEFRQKETCIKEVASMDAWREDSLVIGPI